MRSPIDNLLAGVAPDGPRLAPFGPPASVALAACRTVHCDECSDPAVGQCNGCGKFLCQSCIDRHRRDADRAECRGRWNEPRADELIELRS